MQVRPFVVVRDPVIHQRVQRAFSGSKKALEQGNRCARGRARAHGPHDAAQAHAKSPAVSCVPWSCSIVSCPLPDIMAFRVAVHPVSAHCLGGQAPVRRNTEATVSTMIFRSSASDCRSM